MKKNKTVNIWITILLLYSAPVWAQSPISSSLPKITPVSPEASALIKYVDYPVDHSSGLVPIEIPLFEIKEGDIVLPISLTYHSSGLKVKENDGLVGNGWTLNAEPSITRTVNGLKDDLNNYQEIGFLWHDHSSSIQNRIKAAEGKLDIESDTYYFKLAQKGGKFYFVRKTNGFDVVNYPFGNERISYTGYLDNFAISDENGIFYSFGNTKEFNGAQNQWSGTTTRWMCDYIRSQLTGAEITFQYNDKPLRTLTWDMTDKVTVTTSIQNLNTFHTLSEYRDNICTTYDIDQRGERGPASSSAYIPESGFTSIHNYECYLSQINFAQGRVVFTVNTTDGFDKLQYMEVFNMNDQLIKKVQFFVTKFNPDTEHTKLDSVHILDSSGSKIVERYRFLYLNASIVPAMSSRSIDHWGYFNKANNDNSVLVPNGWIRERWGGTGPEIYYQIGSATRSSSIYMDAGILYRIYWPGGRYTTFEYEMNDYYYHNSNDGPTPVNVGGMRIKRIEEKDVLNSVNHYRVFNYLSYGETGVVKIKPELANHLYCNEYWSKRDINTVITKRLIRTWTAMSLANLVFSNGAPVRYFHVEEFKYASNNMDEKMKTVYKYRRGQGRIYKSNCKPYAEDSESDWEAWQIESEKKYLLESNQTEKLLSEKTMTYEKSDYETTINKRKIYFKNILTPYESYYFTEQEKYDATTEEEYPIVGSIMLPKTETNKEYFSDGSFVQTQKTNEYRQYPTQKHHTNPVKITTTTPAATIVEDFEYPQDRADIDGGALANCNAINKPITYKRKENENDRPQEIRCSYVGTQLYSIHTNSEYNGYEETRLVYHNYDDYGNPVCVSKEHDGPKIVYIWGYKMQYPVAKIESTSNDADFYNTVINAIGANDMNILKNIPTDSEVRNIFSNLRINANMKGALITSYTYKPLVGVTSETDPSGQTVYYDYDAQGRLSESYLMENNQKKKMKSFEYNITH